mgnify:CR=1 FL=1
MTYIYQKNRGQKEGVTGPKPKIDLYKDMEIVEKIRADYTSGRTVKALMLEYGLSRATVYRILKSLHLT